ncbi:conserved hypothetical protein [Phenylobacterium zucineum HLK1]|uniref:17 kDa surface antigen n=1 Tax=Phenylobacterium zucineum (strain HLK1) TaxID=450851 RepID=B4R9Y8_PHEZH|nr:hypothetical protein [Phenylobacterium zucineum]ACG79492.1 conserved hypothetical protein [Phenylobacterium zucineum HLK1]
MRPILISAVLAAAAGGLGACASTGYDSYASACERDYQRNRAAATAAGAVIGGAAGAAVAKDDAAGAAIGAVAGGIIGNQLAKRDDPCGYGFGGYPVDPAYGYWDERRGRWVRR